MARNHSSAGPHANCEKSHNRGKIRLTQRVRRVKAADASDGRRAKVRRRGICTMTRKSREQVVGRHKVVGRPRVVIVGGGFGGLYAAHSMHSAPADVTLIDRRNFHLFQPLLYQVATGGLSPEDIASPLRGVLKNQKNTRVLTGQVIDIDPERRVTILEDGDEIAYDALVIATGANHHYFGRDREWEDLAPGLKTIEDAVKIRKRISMAHLGWRGGMGFANSSNPIVTLPLRLWVSFGGRHSCLPDIHGRQECLPHLATKLTHHRRSGFPARRNYPKVNPVVQSKSGWKA